MNTRNKLAARFARAYRRQPPQQPSELADPGCAEPALDMDETGPPGAYQDPLAPEQRQIAVTLQASEGAANPQAWLRAQANPRIFGEPPTQITHERHSTMNRDTQPSAPAIGIAIGARTVFKGDLATEDGDIVLAGEVSGSVTTKGSAARIDITSDAIVAADLTATVVQIAGAFEGGLRADRVLTRRAAPDTGNGAGESGAAVTLGARSAATGSLVAPDNAHVCLAGRFAGDITAPGESQVELLPGSVSEIRALAAHTLDIAGDITGELVARKQAVIRSGAHVRGTLTCPSEGLVIERGARLRVMLVCETPAEHDADAGAPAPGEQSDDGDHQATHPTANEAGVDLAQAHA